MKITFIINGYSSNKEGTSGGETRNVAFINHIDKQKHDISICCPQKYHVVKQIKDIELLTYPSLPFEEKTYENLPLLFFVYCYRIIISVFKIRRIKSDVIISSSHLFHDVIPLLFLGNKNLTCVTYIHHIISEQQRKGVSSLITNFLEKISFYVIRKINSIVFTDSEVNKMSLIRKYNFKEKYVHVIKNGINLGFINSVGITKNPVYDICFCGRLNKTKGIFDLVNIVKKVKKDYPDISCGMIGQGKERNNLEKIIKDNNLEDNVQLLGFLGEKEKIKTMKSSKIFVLPSHEEGWGIVIGEAMACEIPVVVYKLKDIVGIWEDNVIWVECFDLNKFSDAIIELLEDENKRNVFIQRGQKFSKTIDWDDILENELNIIVNSR